MQTSTAIVNVAIRELGPDNLFRRARPSQSAPLRPIAVVLCDVRRGRSAVQREALARATTQAVGSAVSFPPAPMRGR